ncbi:MAG: hypothetical protein K8S25_04070 [Alphaproteobacteria bacterium]|nr:hypothetical protein [Alphaproteobacteria bacterium]
MNQRSLRVLASIGLAVGGALGIAGTFAPTDSLRGLAWGVDGASLVMASALLVLIQLREGRDLAAAGFLVFAVGQGLVVSGAPMTLATSVPSFGSGAALWAVALLLISASDAFPIVVRLLGLAASVLFAIVAIQIFAGAQIPPTASPLPFFAYPVFVATMIGWTWTLLRAKT